MAQYDLVVIGSGPGGYVCALRAAQLGMKTALVEKGETLGGTCLNVGCIPSKALLDSSEHFYQAKKTFAEHGIEINEPKVNFEQMIARKSQVVKQTCDGVQFLMDKNKVDVFHGWGSFADDKTVLVSSEDGKEEKLEAKNIVIATGSEPGNLPFIKLDGERVITSTEALELKEVPKHMIVIGGGVIGLELGSVYARLGSEVSVIEYADRIIPGMDGAMSKELQRSMKKIGVKFFTSHQVGSVERQGDEVMVKAKDKKGKEVEWKGDYCLVSVGRRPFTDKLGLDKAGLEADERGQIPVNDHLQTSKSNIYAIGDVVRGAMLAHKAEEEGSLVAEFMAGQKPHIDYNLIPNVVYTWPEVAGVGKTEEQLKEEKVAYKVGQFPIRALGRARASMDIEGLVKILADEKTDEVLGVHIISARAADMIAEAVVAMEFRASAEDIARISHAHPTYMEAVKEAAMDATEKRALHI
jgi:dihydrolipoamide dehydrogenase